MRLCRSSQADTNGLTYSAANRSRLDWRSCSCDSDHVQTAHSPIATEISHCMGSSSSRWIFLPERISRFAGASPGASRSRSHRTTREAADSAIELRPGATLSSARSEGVTVACKLKRKTIRLRPWGPAVRLHVPAPLVAGSVADHASSAGSAGGARDAFTVL